MSRHRIVRSMNYSDEYDGYDDVYGHSVEDDYSMSPSDAAFMYDRDSRQPAQFSAFLTTEDDILEEEDETAVGGSGGRKDSFVKPPLSDVDEARLRSCRDEVQSVVGDSLPDSTLDETILRCDFDVARTLDALLQSPPTKSAVDKPPANLETSVSKTKSAAKHEGKDDFNIMSSDCDSTSKTLKKGNVAGQIKRMSTAEQIAASVASNQGQACNQSKGKIVNGPMFSSSRASGFSSLKALKMKHKQTSSEPDKSRSRDAVEERLVEKIVECAPVEMSRSNNVESEDSHIGVEKNLNKNIGIGIDEKKVENVESAPESRVSGGEVESASKIASTVDKCKPRSVCTPGRSSSLAALAKRCRNNSDRRPPPALSVLQNSSDISDCLQLEFEKFSVDDSTVNSENKVDRTTKGTVVIDLMAALHSPSDEKRKPALDESDTAVEPMSDVHSELLQDVRANTFTNFVMVKNEFQTISCSPFGEIICKTFVCDCRELVFAPEVIDSTVERFAFDVMSPDDEIRKFRKNW